MKTILEKFANGEIPGDRPYNPTPEYKKALSTLSNNKLKLLATLNDMQKALFEDFIDAQSELIHLYHIEDVVYGYKLGVSMTAEVFLHKR